MVKGKVQPAVSKPLNSKKSMAKSTPSASPATSSQKGGTQVQVPSCSGCGVIITDDTKALQCDRCTSADAWKCADCLHLPGGIYDHLVSDNNVALKWFCASCDKTVMSQANSSQCSQDDKLDHLIKVIEKLMDRYENIERSLEKKCDVSEVAELDKRMRQLEERFWTLDKELETRFNTVETQLKTLDKESETRFNSVETQLKTNPVTVATEKENAISDEDMIKFVVQEELKKKTEEDQDMESRKRNIIIYRVPEKRMDSVSDRKASDLAFVKDLLDGVFSIELNEQDIDKMYRLGRFSEDKARPLLVAFKCYEQKDQIMANLRKLKQPIEKFRGISISHDLHPKEREERKRLLALARQEHEANESEQVENYKFLVVGRGQQRRVIKLKRSNITDQPRLLAQQN